LIASQHAGSLRSPGDVLTSLLQAGVLKKLPAGQRTETLFQPYRAERRALYLVHPEDVGELVDLVFRELLQGLVLEDVVYRLADSSGIHRHPL
jgi:hypothetical protein